ncbi:MAG: ATP-dependent RNA helicase HrpA [Luteococcus sp.]|uniref:ATP-dependent RNA helicase HrpA n=1 Tax=Luteococcus sp. TaxID=1969402 RepID=UPI002647322D|nr:ATP-dependent RNA helicase HrpA [Luteococcus sp.]MDN5563071.1 ATP-dependent RNA helicase HrpA [Luteococcus sp.]
MTEPRQMPEPRLEFDPSLPIAEHADEIAAFIREHQVVVVAGETGSGKTTQIPKICLALGRGRIAHTQPRRIAARTVAERIAEECDTPLGDLVGYQVRFTRKAGKDTRVKVMTDGVLLAEITHDRDLRRYDTIIIDEAHERSLNIDFLLGYLKQLLPRRPELRVIVTSATIDTARFAEHFSNTAGEPAPVLEVSGRTHPVEMRYRPLVADGETAEVADQIDGICKAVTELSREGAGDILVFLSGEREIRDAAEAVNGLKLSDTEVLPLYARLSAAEQHRVFTAHTGRRVVLATNVAETSITVPGIRYVIDPGMARISRYSARTKVQRLPIEPVSQASANQRSGRCGRVAPGIAIRLYSEQDFLARPEFTEPEILRTNLASVILQMAEAGLGDIGSFPFVEAPDRGQITDGLRLLDELGALKPGSHSHPKLTRVGHRLARIPLDPRLGRMLLEAERQGCVREVQVLVAGLAIPDVRERPAEKREQADQLHRRFWTAVMPQPEPEPEASEGPKRHTAHTRAAERVAASGGEPDSGGDIMAMLRLWDYLRSQKKALSGNAFRRMCRDEFIHFLRVREWEDLHAQLRDISKEIGLERNSAPAPADKVLTAVLAGLLGHVGLADLREQDQPKKDRNGKRRRPGPREYLGARGARFAIQPGSALAKNPPPLVMAVELVETSRLWARTVAAITAEQVEEVAGDLLKRSYSEPHWSTNSGSVVAYEKVTLYGVPVIAERPVSYARIDPVVAREIFIRSALVEGQWRTRHHFFHHNRKVREQAEELEERSRRRDITVDDQQIFDFYDARIPAEVVSVQHLDAWLRRLPDKRLLEMGMDDLLAPEADQVDAGDFPDHWVVPARDGGELRFDIDYVFDPGSGHDGVTVAIPLAQLNQVSAEPFSWQVPGLRHELATELIRALPKSVRTSFVPAPNHARAALDWLDEMAKVGQGPDHSTRFCDELGRALRQLTSVTVEPQQWSPDAVPDHLRIAFRITENGRETRRSKDFADLRQDLARKVSQTLTRASAKKAVTGATSWTMGPIDRTLQVEKSGTKAIGYPALKDEGSSVGVVVLDTAERASQSHAKGLRRLLVLTLPDPTKWVVSHLSNPDKLALGNSPYASVPSLLTDARLKTAEQLARRWAQENKLGLDDVRDAQTYERLALFVRQEQADAMRAVVATAAEALRNATAARLAIGSHPAGEVREDVTAQLDNLVFTNFISATPDPWYGHLPRYVKGITLRLAGAASSPSRDRQGALLVDELEAEYARLCDAQPPGPLPAAVEEIGFLIEELRVQQFAQQLRTAVTVSPKRIRKAMAEAH